MLEVVSFQFFIVPTATRGIRDQSMSSKDQFSQLHCLQKSTYLERQNFQAFHPPEYSWETTQFQTAKQVSPCSLPISEADQLINWLSIFVIKSQLLLGLQIHPLHAYLLPNHLVYCTKGQTRHTSAMRAQARYNQHKKAKASLAQKQLPNVVSGHCWLWQIKGL